MSYLNANTVDVLRCSQKDEQFTDLYSHYIHAIVRLCGNNIQNKLRIFLHPMAESLYYGLTSVSNLQTLGEEYTATLRYSPARKHIPSKSVHILWLLLYVGGENVIVRALDYCERYFKTNESLTQESKSTLIKTVKFIKNNKDIVTRFHQALFFINGKYYNISNRLTGIEYILLRKWTKDDQSNKVFNFIGNISYLYLMCMLINKCLEYSNSDSEQDNEVISREDTSVSHATCHLCAGSRVKPAALTCGHVFCWTCILNAIKYDQKCPVCREQVQRNRIILLQNY